MQARGVERVHKKAPRPSKKDTPLSGLTKAEVSKELKATTKRVKKGWAYLNRQFDQALEEDGNSAEVRQLLKAIEAREAQLLAEKARLDAGHGLGPSADRGSYDLSGDMEPSPAPDS